MTSSKALIYITNTWERLLALGTDIPDRDLDRERVRIVYNCYLVRSWHIYAQLSSELVQAKTILGALIYFASPLLQVPS
jgi:hypothetical protein